MPTLHEQIQALLKEEKMQEALNLFAQSNRDGILLQGQYNLLIREKPLHILDEWQISINRIGFSLLELTKPEPPGLEPAGDIRTQVLYLMVKGKTEEALRLLISVGYKGAEALLDRYNTTQRQYRYNEIDHRASIFTLVDIENDVLGLAYPPKKGPLWNRFLNFLSIPIDSAQKQSMEEAASQIRQAMFIGNVEEVVKLFLRTDSKEAALFYKEFYVSIMVFYRKSITGHQYFVNRQLSICHAILKSAWMQESGVPTKRPSDLEKSQVLQLLEERKTAQALAICKDFGDEYLLAQVQFAITQIMLENEVITNTQLETSNSRVRYVLHELLEQIPGYDWSSIQSGIYSDLDDFLTLKGDRPSVGRPPNVPSVQIDPAQKLSKKEAAPLIRQALFIGDVDEAVRLCLRAGTKQAVLYHERIVTAKKQHSMGVIDVEDWSGAQGQICYAILEEDWMQESSAPKKYPSQEEKAHILQLLDGGKTAHALVICKNLGDYYLLLQARFAASQIKFEKNMMSKSQLEISNNRIHYALEELLRQRPQHNDAPRIDTPPSSEE